MSGHSAHGRAGHNNYALFLRRSVADADPSPHTLAVTVDNPLASHAAVTGICVGVVICVGAAIVIRSAEAERQSRPEPPAKTTTTVPVAAMAMPMLSVGSCRK